MRRSALLPAAALALLAGAAPAGSHPDHGPVSVSIANFAYSPGTVDVQSGDSVMWLWDGADRNHSVTADPGQAEAFDSDPGGPPSQETHKPSDGFAHTFHQVGSFAYHCKVHATMKGTVRVAPAPGGAAPPDVTPPALSKVVARPARMCTNRSRRCARRGTVLEFTLGEKADVLVEIHRVRNGRAYGREVDALDPRGKPGRNRVRVTGNGLRPGRYRISVTATDVAGNSSRTRRLNVEVRR